ncbi:MAG: CPBP family intramembrane metalloprotease [Bacilli bacterium]|nr:CPBP family intramembrane metalloprotease [Bacilli bacterium]
MKNKITKTLFTYLFLSLILQMILIGIKNYETPIIYTLGTISNNILVLLAVSFINRYEIKEMFNKFKKKPAKNLKKNLIIWMIGFILMMVANYIIIIIIPEGSITNEILVREMYSKYLIASFISFIIIVPMIEEIVFRLSFNNISNKYLYLISSSLVFSVLHSLGSINNLISIIYILPYLILGITFGLVYYRSENVFDSISIHSLHNLVVLICYIIF